MKKVFAVLVILIIIGGAFTGFGYYTWQKTGEEIVPMTKAEILGKELQPSFYVWHQPLLGGLTTKTLSRSLNSIVKLGEYQELPELSPTRPEGFESNINVRLGDAELYSGKSSEWDNSLLQKNGEYFVDLKYEKIPDGNNGYGYFEYHAEFTLNIPEPAPKPEFAAGKADLQQGDILSLRLSNIPEGIVPKAETNLGNVVFTSRENGGWDAAIAISNYREPGEYPVHVQAGELVWDVTVKVSKFNFPEQNLIIDTGSAQITEANSARAYEQYRKKIPPLFETWDEIRYWDGMFIQPVHGPVTTNFGEIRYTNGDYSNSRSHNGVDIAADEGAEIAAPNNGKVVLAEYLLNTGNTIVIEHGGGLKSYYFHLSQLGVEPGQMVKTGDIIGAVGSTGYSTGPHLHFEMRIGDQPISPQMLFEKEAGLYSLGTLLKDEEEQ